MTSPSPKTTAWRLRVREQRAVLLTGDLLVSLLALLGGLYFWAQQDAWLDFSWNFLRLRVEPWFYLLPLAWMVLLVELYDPHRARSLRQTVTWIAFAALAGLLGYSLIYLLSPQGSLPRLGIGSFLVFASVLTFLWRLLFIQIFTAQAYLRRVLIIGAGKAGEALARVYEQTRPQPFFLVGFIDDDPRKVGRHLLRYPVLSGSDRLLETIESEAVNELVVAITGNLGGDTFQAILDAQDRGVDVVPMPTLYEELLGRVPIHHLQSDWLLRSFMDEARTDGFYEIGKRLMDLLVGLVGMAVFCLLYLPVALLIRLDSRGPVIYKQVRSGRGGRPYLIHKFRTMRQDAEKDGKARLTRRKDERITRVGNFLRRTHIDETPQFWNVLRGDMSIVGPRAERPEWIAEFQKQIPFYRARLLVKPGITGWAQVNYSYYATIEEMGVKLEYDLYYIKHRNLLMDFSIILRTITQVIAFRGR